MKCGIPEEFFVDFDLVDLLVFQEKIRWKS